MANTYAPPVPTLSGENYTASYLLNNPRIIWRLLNTIAQQRLVGARLLTGRVDLTGSGAVVYQTQESIFANDTSAIIGELEEYPLTDDTSAPPSLATSLKRGLAELVSLEDVARNRLDVLQRKLIKLANRVVIDHDAIVLSAIGSAVTATQAAVGPWNGTGTTPNPFLDLLNAKAQIDELNLGYTADTVVVTPQNFAYLVNAMVKFDAVAASDLPGLLQANMVRAAGLNIWQTTNMPTGVTALVADSTLLGSIGFERLGGGYNGDPSDPLGIESKTWMTEKNDGWRIQARKIAVPIVQEPGAAVKLTGN